jgi:predicted PurR-regulated permease PerM
MRDALRTVWANPYVRVLSGLAALAACVWAFVAVQPAAALFLTAMGLAYLVNPVVDALHARRVPRGVGVALVAVVLAGLFSGIASLAVLAVRGLLSEAEHGVTLNESVTAWFDQLPANLERLVPTPIYEALAGPLATVGDVLREAGRALAPYVERIGATLVELVGDVAAGVGFAVLLLVLTVYVLHDYHRFTKALLQAWPRPYQATVADLAKTLDRVVGGYVRGQVVIAIAVGTLVYVGLALVGLPLAGFVGVLAGLLNVVPFLGTIVPAIPALLIAIGGGWWQVLLVLVVFVVANQIDNHVLTPLVLSKSTTLHPVTVMVAVIGGFAVGGVLGALFAVPLVAFARVLYTELYLTSRFYREG